MDAIIPLSHKVSCQQLREKMAELIPDNNQPFVETAIYRVFAISGDLSRLCD